MSKPRLIIGICGLSGSGKTLLCKNVSKHFPKEDILVLRADSYYRDQRHMTFEMRQKTNFDHPDSIDEVLMESHLKSLLSGDEIDMPVYDFSQHTRIDEIVKVKPAPVILLEGILIFANPSLVELMDIKAYMDVQKDICLIRRLKRDLEERGRNLETIIDHHLERVAPMALKFIEQNKNVADIMIPNGGKNQVAIDLLLARISEHLTAYK